jgi:hypothetical protein
MFCGNCGAGEQSEGAYCRRCGKWPGGNPPHERMKVSLIFSGINAVLAAASAIVLYATYLGTSTGTPAVYIAASFSCVIAAHQTTSFFFQLSLIRRLKRGRDAAQNATLDNLIDARQTPFALKSADTSEFVRAPSVVEGTTELLEPVPRTSKRDR